MKKPAFVLILLSLLISTNSCKQTNTKESERDRFVSSLLSKMTIDEKIGQLTLSSGDWAVTGPTLNPDYEKFVKEGKCGNILNTLTVEYIKKLQKIAVQETRLGIPLLFGFDVIHGYKTTYPIPLAEACTWDLEIIEKTARYSAKEATAAGLNWTFNPMVDIARDPRWGRIAEGSGEDPYLASLIAKAKVYGYQGDSLNDPSTMAACVKHYAAYGAPHGGRDYNTVDMSDRMLREIYLPPYKAAVDAGVATVMSSFNELDGVPATGSKYLMTKILRNEWGFKGFIVTDYTSMNEMVNHGIVKDEKEAGELALKAGIDMDMQGTVYSRFLKKSLEEGNVTEIQINEAVRRILNLKYDLGLFKDPYLYLDEKREKATMFSPEFMEHALLSAKKSIVLLKNEPFNVLKLLPLDKKIKNIALIGPLADNQVALLGAWYTAGDKLKVVTVLEGLKKKYPQAIINSTKGADFSGNDKSDFANALKIARQADLVICAIGESEGQSGEASSRSDIGLPGVQQELMQELVKTGKPIVAVVLAGRPLTIGWLKEHVSAIVFAGHLGTRSGDAIAEVLSGDYNPSGKLVITFPKNTGQIPIYYAAKNTGRPYNKDNWFTTKYLDVTNEPLYPFGYGLSYTTFEYSQLKLNTNKIGMADTLEISFKLKNTGQFDGEEITQLYIRDLVGSVTRPIKELKGFHKVNLKVDEQIDITFKITASDLKFYDANMKFVAEPGEFKVFVGGNSVNLMETEFELLK
jgi:beta-glucosidase